MKVSSIVSQEQDILAFKIYTGTKSQASEGTVQLMDEIGLTVHWEKETSTFKLFFLVIVTITYITSMVLLV